MFIYESILIVYILLWIANLIYILKRKDNRFLSLITYIFLGFIFISNSGDTGDAQLYKNYFENQNLVDLNFEFGYNFIAQILYSFGIYTYTGLLIALYVLSTFFLWLGLRKMDVSYHCLFAIVMPFIFPTYATAIRFFVASTILISAIKYLFERKYLIFTVLLIFAASFHTLSIIYFLFFLGAVDFNYRWKIKRILLWFIAILSVVLFGVYIILKTNFMTLLLSYVVPMLFIINDSKMDAYFTTNTNWGGAVFFVVYICGLLLAIVIKKYVDNDNGVIHVNDRIKNYSELNYNVNLILSMIIPLLAINLVFYRLLIIGHITNAILLGMVYKNNTSKKPGQIIIINTVTIAFIVCCMFWFIPEFVKIQSISIRGIIEAMGVYN